MDVQCTDVCNDVCTPVPQKVCNDVPYQTQVCNKVPVPKTKQICNRICTKTTTYQETINTTPQVVSSGKGGENMVMVSAGKGHRRLAGAQNTDGLPLLGHLAGKAMLAGKIATVAAAAPVMSAGKGVVSTGKGVSAPAPQTDVQCNDVCNDVQITEYQTQCNMVTNTKTKCDIVFQQKCDKVCRPNCRKITTVTSTTTTAVSTGKGTPMVSMGKGH